MNPLDTSDYEVPFTPTETAKALREMADGEDDFMGRLLSVAAIYVEALPQMIEAVARLQPCDTASQMGPSDSLRGPVLSRDEVLSVMNRLASSALSSAESLAER